VDRLAVLADRVVVADYKTSRLPPARAEDVPVLYLRQMAAYRALLRALYPGRAVDCVLVWTNAVQVMMLPDALLDSHAPGALTGAQAGDHFSAQQAGEPAVRRDTDRGDWP